VPALLCRRFLRGGRDGGTIGDDRAARLTEPTVCRVRASPRVTSFAGAARDGEERPARFRARHVLPFAGARRRSRPPRGAREEGGGRERTCAEAPPARGRGGGWVVGEGARTTFYSLCLFCAPVWAEPLRGQARSKRRCRLRFPYPLWVQRAAH
jgi:hypothetical protein